MGRERFCKWLHSTHNLEINISQILVWENKGVVPYRLNAQKLLGVADSLGVKYDLRNPG